MPLPQQVHLSPSLKSLANCLLTFLKKYRKITHENDTMIAIP
jgi:hypothetical protein